MKKYILTKALVILFFVVFIGYIILMFRFRSEREIIVNITALIFIIIMFSSIPICIIDHQLTKKKKTMEFKNELIEKQSIKERELAEKQVKLEKEKEDIKSKFEKQKIIKIEESSIEQLYELITNSDKINLNTMGTTLNLDKKIFDEIIFEWADKYDFTIDGDYLLINNREVISSFLNYLRGQVKQKQKVYCKHCGKWIGEDLSICPHCLNDQ